MNKINRFFVIVLLAVVATLVAVVSCKKETPNTLLNSGAQQEKAFVVPEVDDMNAYLKDFKQRMQSSTRGDDETLSLEEAAWHLSSVANYDFGHANVEYDDVRFDTLYSTVTITNGSILLDDLADAYENISVLIDNFYQNLELENKHFRFIGCEISEQGEMTIAIITTFTNGAKWHYFSDSTFCDTYFSDYVDYIADYNATSALQSVFNLILGHEDSPSGRIYYVKSRDKGFYFKHWLEDEDNYCPNIYHYRLFCTKGYFYNNIPKYDMCYYADSYIDLGASNANLGESVLSGTVEFVQGIIEEYENRDPNEIEECMFGHHFLTVTYGYAMSGNLNGY